MDPHVVFRLREGVPNRFALTLAAVARTRALNRGAEPRLDRFASVGNGDLALHEIAAAFTPAEFRRTQGIGVPEWARFAHELADGARWRRCATPPRTGDDSLMKHKPMMKGETL